MDLYLFWIKQLNLTCLFSYFTEMIYCLIQYNDSFIKRNLKELKKKFTIKVQQVHLHPPELVLEEFLIQADQQLQQQVEVDQEQPGLLG